MKARSPFSPKRSLSVASLLFSAVMLASCESFPSSHSSVKTQTADDRSKNLRDSSLGAQIVRAPKEGRDGRNVDLGEGAARVEQSPSQLGYVPVLADQTQNEGDESPRAPRLKSRSVDAFVKPLPVPEFIDVVFGGMLKTSYVTGPGVANMTDIVQLRSSGDIKSSDFLVLVSAALEQYGVRVIPENGTYQIIEDKALRARIPKFIKSRARQRTRSDLRPIVQFVELQALGVTEVLTTLKPTFANQADRLSISANGVTNSIILSGLPSDVDAALKVIREIDELNYAGTQVRRYAPRYWKAAELAKQMERALTVEGWQVTTIRGQTRTIFLMPIDYSNDLLIFTKSAAANQRVSTWLKELDRPIDGGDSEQIFIYQVRNVDASLLAETANAALAGRSNTRADFGADGAVAPGGVQNQSRGGDFTVDPLGNRIVFTGTANDYDKLIKLLERLDTPAPEVLIEVQIAEVTLNDSTSTGVDFLIDDIGGENLRGTAQTTGIGRGSSGFNVSLLTGNVDASINAFASNRKVKVLSTPILVARSGGAASIQVGSDVPIITSQSAANSQTIGGTTDILQTVEYRSTGVLLTIEPIVFSGDRIDLTISQEVSSTLDVANSSISSPTISNRTLSTQLSLEDGATAVLGGLIQENTIRDDKGIPFLKDIPAIGQVFSADSYSVDRTELVVLITAYVLRGQADKRVFVNRLRGSVDELISDDSRLVTLKPKQF